MAQSFISEIGDQLGGDGVANTEGEHVKIISAEYYKRIDNGVVSNVRIQDAISSTGNGKVVATDQSSVNSEFKLLATASASPTSGALTEAVYDTGITMNPSTNTLTANLSGTATYAKALDPQMILNTTLYKVPVISADKEVRWSGAPGASGSTTELTYDNTDSKNLLSVNVSGSATSIYQAFASSYSSAVAETTIIDVSGRTDGFKLTYGATTPDLGITKLYTIDDANAKLSFGNMVSSTYKEALVITNGSANLTGTVNGYSINKSVPSNAVFTDTTYESKAAASGGTAVSLCTTGEKYQWNNKANPNIVQHKPYGASKSNCAVLFNADDPASDVWVEVGASSGSTSLFGYLLNSTQKQKLDNVIMSLRFVDAFPSSYTTGVLYLL